MANAVRVSTRKRKCPTENESVMGSITKKPNNVTKTKKRRYSNESTESSDKENAVVELVKNNVNKEKFNKKEVLSNFKRRGLRRGSTDKLDKENNAHVKSLKLRSAITKPSSRDKSKAKGSNDNHKRILLDSQSKARKVLKEKTDSQMIPIVILKDCFSCTNSKKLPNLVMKKIEKPLDVYDFNAEDDPGEFSKGKNQKTRKGKNQKRPVKRKLSLGKENSKQNSNNSMNDPSIKFNVLKTINKRTPVQTRTRKKGVKKTSVEIGNLCDETLEGKHVSNDKVNLEAGQQRSNSVPREDELMCAAERKNDEKPMPVTGTCEVDISAHTSEKKGDCQNSADNTSEVKSQPVASVYTNDEMSLKRQTDIRTYFNKSHHNTSNAQILSFFGGLTPKPRSPRKSSKVTQIPSSLPSVNVLSKFLDTRESGHFPIDENNIENLTIDNYFGFNDDGIDEFISPIKPPVRLQNKNLALISSTPLPASKQIKPSFLKSKESCTAPKKWLSHSVKPPEDVKITTVGGTTSERSSSKFCDDKTNEEAFRTPEKLPCQPINPPEDVEIRTIGGTTPERSSPKICEDKTNKEDIRTVECENNAVTPISDSPPSSWSYHSSSNENSPSVQNSLPLFQDLDDSIPVTPIRKSYEGPRKRKADLYARLSKQYHSDHSDAEAHSDHDQANGKIKKKLRKKRKIIVEEEEAKKWEKSVNSMFEEIDHVELCVE